VDINNYTKYTFVKKLYKRLNFNLNKKNLFIMGLTFKKDTDDARNSSSVDIVLEILKELSRVHVYDPKAKNINVIKNSSNVDLVSRLVSPYVKKNYDAVVVLTDWGLFKKLNYKSILQNSNESPFFVDSRSFINKTIIRLLGFKI
jgi:UDPglucose 6-dehydrogenase